MSRSILITGATGSIGGQVVKQLVDRGASLRALVRSEQKAAALAQPGVEAVIGDLAKPDTLAAALEGVERAFLLTGPDLAQAELQGNFIEAAKKAGVKHLVKLSALGVAEESPIILARLHWQTEQQLAGSGLGYTILQPHFFMQNLLGFASTIATEGKFYAPLKDGKIGMVDVRDIAAVAVATLMETGHDGQTYVITGPESLSFAEVAEKISAAIARPVSYIDVPPEAAQQAMQAMGMPDWFVNDMLTLYAVFRAGHGDLVTDTVAKIGGKNPISFDQFAKDFAHVFKGN